VLREAAAGLAAGVEDAVATEVVVTVEVEGVCGADVREIQPQPYIYAPANFWVKEAVFNHAVGVEEDAADPEAEVDPEVEADPAWGAVAPEEARR
jgi:hypothetical protein